MPESEVGRLVDRIDTLENEREFGERKVADCREIQPTRSRLVGSGNNRCVFEKQGKIVKVARNRDGRTETEGARAVMENVSQENRDIFMMPEDIDKSNTVMVTEKADQIGGGRVIGESNLIAVVDERLAEAYKEDKLHCNDIGYDDVGMKDEEPVLTDLGGCSKVE